MRPLAFQKEMIITVRFVAQGAGSFLRVVFVIGAFTTVAARGERVALDSIDDLLRWLPNA